MNKHFNARLPALSNLTSLVCFRYAINKYWQAGELSKSDFDGLRMQLVIAFAKLHEIQP